MSRSLKTAITAAMSAAVLLVSACGSGQNEAPASPEQSTAQQSAPGTTTRTITDLTGQQVTLPPAAEIARVAVITPQLVGTIASVTKHPEVIVGMPPSVAASGNKQLFDLIIPGWQSIDTEFVVGYTPNREELLKLDPDLVLVYGPNQREGLDDLGIPVVDFLTPTQDNREWSVAIDELTREIFEIDDSSSLDKEWDTATQRANQVLDGLGDDQKLKGLEVFTNAEGKITIRGNKSYAADWMERSGIINVAAELESNSEVTMEQIYAWDPDIIYIFGYTTGEPAENYLNNSISGQDWSAVSAVKSGKVYDLPTGITNWGAPCVDSPLAIEWLVMNNYPDATNAITADEFSRTAKDFFERQYGVQITDEILHSVVNPAR